MKLKSYELNWKEVSIPNDSINIQGKTLLIGNQSSDLKELFQKFESSLGEDNIITCTIGELFDNKNYKQFEIDSSCPDNIIRLLQRTEGVKNIIFLPMLKQYDYFSIGDLNISQEKGIYILFELIKVLLKKSAGFSIKNILLLTTEGIDYKKISNNELNPFEATSRGFLKAARNETSSLSLTSVDISVDELKKIDINIILQIFTSLNNHDLIIKNNKCYKEILYNSIIKRSERKDVGFITNGNYLIIGGASGIGEQIAYFLSNNYKANIQIVGRRKHNTGIDSILKKISTLGGNGEYFEVDILDIKKLEITVEEINLKYGRINGVFSSAVVLADSLIINMTFDSLQKVIRPKTEGTVNLAKVFSKRIPDFICFNSTFNSYYANEGQSNYVAASCFLDSYANYLNSQNWPIKIINWGYWGDLGVGMSPEIKNILQNKGVYPINKQEGIEALDKFMNSSKHQLFLLKMSQDLEERLQIKSYSMDENLEQSLNNQKKTILTIEKTITQILSEELSLDKTIIGADTPFSDLGVDSIMSHSIISKVNSFFNTELKVSDIFNYSTINELRDYIDKQATITSLVSTTNNSLSNTKQADNKPEALNAIDNTKSIEKTITQILSEELSLDKTIIGADTPFSDLGVDSIMSHSIISKVNSFFNTELKVSDIFNYSTINELRDYIDKQTTITSLVSTTNNSLSNTKQADNKPEALNAIDNTKSIEKTITQILSEELSLDKTIIGADTPFSDLGVDSIMSHSIISKVNSFFNTELKVSDIFNYSTINELRDYIDKQTSIVDSTSILDNDIDNLFTTIHQYKKQQGNIVESLRCATEKNVAHKLLKNSNSASAYIEDNHQQPNLRLSPKQDINDDDIAIIGVSGVFGGADNKEELWESLQKGETLVKEIPFNRWDAEQIYDKDASKEGSINSKWGGFMKAPDLFDPLFFKIPPVEAEYMDPQQRIFLREGWKAFEDSGYTEQDLADKRVGVYVGVAAGGGYENLILESNKLNAQAFFGNANSILPARLSYYFNLSGPSVAIDTACSSSLVALNMAYQAIKTKECDMALVGGTSIFSTSDFYLKATKANMLSPTGKCHTFDEKADGFVPGEAVAAIVLKPLKKALEDKDQIYGIIKGIAVNQDGKSNGITAPSGQAQVNLMTGLYEKINITPDSVSYIEAHGTGTKLGDPVEIDSLSKVYQKSKYYLGSIKTNLGHTLPSAGIVGLIKVLMCFKNNTLVPSINYDNPNKLLELEKHNFEVVTSPLKWSRNGNVRRAAVSSFGFSGTNSHVVLEDYENPLQAEEKQVSELFLFSSQTASQLKRYIHKFRDFLLKNPKISLSNIAYTLGTRRNWYSIRLGVIASTYEELLLQINAIIEKFEIPASSKNNLPDISDIIEPIIESANKLIENTTARNKELNYLHSFYISGYTFNLKELFNSRDCYTISLPSFEFEESSYWVSFVDKESNNIKEDCLLYIKNKWEEYQDEELINKQNNNKLSILIIYNSGYLSQSKEAYHQILQIFTNEQQVDFHSLQNLQLSDESRYDVILDLSDLFGEKSDELYSSQLNYLQKIINTDSETRILHFINNASKVTNNYLAQGFYKMLNSEYKKINASSIIIEADSPLQLAKIISEEIYKTNLYGLYKYEKNKKYKNSVEEVDISSSLNKNKLDINGIYAISGGLGDIGFEVSKYLINSGVKNIALISERNLNNKKLENLDKVKLKEKRLEHLKELGANVFIYVGELTDNSKLQEFINEIERNTDCKIKGFIHCAGIAKSDHPSLKNKNIEGIHKLQNPKYQGLQSLADVFSEVDLFVVFSSISSLFPHLAVGASDYSSVNYFMDKYIDYLSKINPKIRYVSIEWSNWLSTEMGTKVSSFKVSEMGICGYTYKRGIEILDQIITSDIRGTIAPVITESTYNKWKELIKLRPEFKQEHKQKFNISPSIPKETHIISGDKKQILINKLLNIFSLGLKIPIEKIEQNVRFNDLGVDSILIAELVIKIEKELNIKLNPTILIEYPSISQLADYLSSNYSNLNFNNNESEDNINQNELKKDFKNLKSENSKQYFSQHIQKSFNTEKKVAVIGLACNFPGASNIQEYWDNLVNKVLAIQEVPESRWKISNFYSPEKQPNKSYLKVGGFISDISQFDYDYFNISKEDAEHFDPLVRQVLENSVQLLRSAGYTQQDLKGSSTGVYIGSRISDYSKEINPYKKNSIIGIGQNFIAAYLSHYLDLKGPSLVLDSACSSSLVSIHQAVQAIKSGDCVQAIAGGVDILLNERPYLLLSASKALSETGLCKTFDKDADGFVPGEGCGLVLLKDLETAIKDGDIIYSVIESSAVNNDGNTMGVTTPDFDSQYQVIRKAIDKANLSSEDIECVEVHGTGTMIGDPIELKALMKAFRKDTDKKQFCGIGSVKSNFGHLLSAAGIASFIKMVLSVYNSYMPPTLNCENPNERFDFQNSPFYILQNAQPWTTPKIKRAGISAFGFGGTNCHLILREPSEKERENQARKPYKLHKYDKKKVWVNKEEIQKIENVNAILKIEEI